MAVMGHFKQFNTDKSIVSEAKVKEIFIATCSWISDKSKTFV